MIALSEMNDGVVVNMIFEPPAQPIDSLLKNEEQFDRQHRIFYSYYTKFNETSSSCNVVD